MKEWKIRFKTPFGFDEWNMYYPFEPDEETIITDIVENQGEFYEDEIRIVSIKEC